MGVKKAFQSGSVDRETGGGAKFWQQPTGHFKLPNMWPSDFQYGCVKIGESPQSNGLSSLSRFISDNVGCSDVLSLLNHDFCWLNLHLD